LAAIIGLLVEIRDLLKVATEPVPEQEPTEPPCQHPDEQRLDLSGSGEDWWQCQACGFEHRVSRRARSGAKE